MSVKPIIYDLPISRYVFTNTIYEEIETISTSLLLSMSGNGVQTHRGIELRHKAQWDMVMGAELAKLIGKRQAQ